MKPVEFIEYDGLFKTMRYRINGLHPNLFNFLYYGVRTRVYTALIKNDIKWELLL